MVGTFKDVQQRKAIELALRESEQLYRSVISAIAEAVTMVRADGSIAACNNSACDVLGLSESHLLTMGLPDFEGRIHSESGELLSNSEFPTRIALTTGEPQLNTVIGIEFANDDLRWMLVNSQPLFKPGETKPYAAVTTYSDISERRQTMLDLERARASAEEATRAKGEFLAAMSHEIRTPMNGVMGMCEVLLGSGLNDEQREQTEEILESARSLLAVINDVLDLSRIESGRVELERIPFDAHSTIIHVLNMLMSEAKKKKLELSLDYPSDLHAWFEGDQGRFRQVLVNLIGNALRYTDRGFVRVRVRWDNAAQVLSVDVVDSGIGVPPELITRLFNRFSQINESSRRRAGGTGLGLAISKTIAERLGGRIDVISEAGAGSTFTFHVPLVPLTHLSADPSSAEDTRPSDTSLQDAAVLLVEDNAINRKVAQVLLTRLGCRVETAEDGAEGVEMALAGCYDAILMDCMMPVMDGFEAVRAIRAKEADGHRTPIIALTASVMEDERRRCVAAGMDAILAKPVESTALAAVLQEWIRKGNGQ
jgi:PAS domain S-box-containing protein